MQKKGEVSATSEYAEPGPCVFWKYSCVAARHKVGLDFFGPGNSMREKVAPRARGRKRPAQEYLVQVFLAPQRHRRYSKEKTKARAQGFPGRLALTTKSKISENRKCEKYSCKKYLLFALNRL